MGGKHRIEHTTESSDEEKHHHFDFVQDIGQLAEPAPEQPKPDNEEQDQNQNNQQKKRKKKQQNKDPFEHLHAYENIITQAFKSSIEQGNPAALKFMKEQN